MMAYRSLVLVLGFLVMTGLCPASARADDPMTPEQKEAFEKIVHDYLLQHPEVIVQALQSAKDKMEADAAASAKAALVQQHQQLVADPTSPVAGNPNGDVTIVEFFDYRCPYCKEVEPSLEALLRDDGKIRIVYKEFPILGKPSVTATRVALAAQKQGKYDAFHAAMMATKGQIDDQVVMQVAKKVGLDLDRVKKDMEGQDVDDIIKRNYDLATVLDIRGTPAFIIGGEVVPGAIDIAALKEKIAAARKAG
jgi:protein-disulfide isomerase